jgi:hypothetical protein
VFAEFAFHSHEAVPQTSSWKLRSSSKFLMPALKVDGARFDSVEWPCSE